MEKLKEADSSLYIAPWRLGEKDAPAPIMQSADIPSKMGALKKFFPRANPIRAGGHVYTTALIGHTTPLLDIKEEIEWWWKEWTHGMWLRPLQCEDTTVLGWLLYSLLSMDLASLTETLSEILGTPVGLRFRMISLGTAGKVPEDNIVKAIHVEVNRKHASSARRKLQEIYGTSQSTFPNGIRLRLVPTLNSPDLNKITRSKVERLRERQAGFTKNIKPLRTWEISQLDYHDSRIGASLRDLIMQIPAPTKKPMALFHHVDVHWKGDGHVISILPQFEPEARSMLMGLLTFLRFGLKDKSNVPRLDNFFTGTAVDRAADAEWDAETGCAITPEDRHVESIFEIDAEYDLSGGDSEIATNGDTVMLDQTPPDRPDPSTLNKTLYGEDSDTVTTLGTNGKQTGRGKKAAQRLKKPGAEPLLLPGTSTARKDKSPTPSRSSDSGLTAAPSVSLTLVSAMTSRIDGIEKQVSKLDGLEKQIKDLSGLGIQLQQALAAFAAFNKPGGQGVPPGGES
jgi:hypothetical protein